MGLEWILMGIEWVYTWNYLDIEWIQTNPN